MKEAIAQIIKQSMDKCTSEQFWAVVTTIGINAFIVSNIDAYKCNPRFIYAIVAFSTLLTSYGAVFIVDRAKSHITHAHMLYRLIDSSTDVEKKIKDFFECTGKAKRSDFSGAGFYVAIIICVYIGLLIRVATVL